MSTELKSGLLSIGIIALGFLVSSPSSAAVYKYVAKGEFSSSSVPTAIAVGDRFEMTLHVDHCAKEASFPAGPGQGYDNNAFFLNAVFNMEFRLAPGSVGNYPGGTMSGPHYLSVADNFHTTPPVDQAYFSADIRYLINGLNFPSAEGLPFFSLDLNLTNLPVDTFNIKGAPNDLARALKNKPIPASGVFDFTSVQVVFDEYRALTWANVDSWNATKISSSGNSCK
jgi:hypothetical protein